MNEPIAQHSPLVAEDALTDLYPATINARGIVLRLVSATGKHDPESQFTVLETVYGLPCDGLVYEDDTDRHGRHLVAVFHGETAERTAIAVCHQWRWQWFAGDAYAHTHGDIINAIGRCMGSSAPMTAHAEPPAGTLVGDYMRKAAA